MNYKHCIVMASLIGLSNIVLAQHSDVEIAIEDGSIVAENRIAEGEFGSESNPPNTTDDPGFATLGGEDTPPTTTFEPFQQVAFQTVDIPTYGSNLLHWDGSGNVNFGPSPHTLEISKSIFSVTLDGTSASNGGFTMFEADAAGFFDEHIDFTLDNPTPSEGVYLFALTLASPNANPTVADSLPIYFVMASQGLDEAIHEAAIDFVATNLVPEPTSGLLLFLGLAGLCRRGRLVTHPVRIR